MADPLTIMAVMAVASAGYSVYQGEQQKKSVAKAEAEGYKQMDKDASELIKRQYEDRMAQINSSGAGSVSAQEIAGQGTVLTSTPKTRSLLGG
jgi:uncharacterized protein HemX